MHGWEAWLSIIVTLCVLGLLITTRIAPYFVLMGALTILSVTGILSATDVLAGFSNSGLITVAAMFVVAAGIHASGGVDWLVNRLMGRPATPRSAILRLFLPVASLSAFLNNTPVVATMIPAVHTWCKRLNVAPSKLMIPLSYSAILGGTVTLIGTSTNLVVNGQYQSLTGSQGFHLFEISLIGLPVALAGLAFMWLFFPSWLPGYHSDRPFENVREFTVEMMVLPQGPLVGRSIRDAGLRNLQRLYLVEIERQASVLPAVSADEVLQGHDRLVFAGDTEAITELLNINGLRAVCTAEQDAGDPLLHNLVEVVVSPHCDAVGYAIRDTRFRQRYGASVVAVARNGERIQGGLGDTVLQAGDTLLLEARPGFLMRQKYSKDFLLVSAVEYEKTNHKKAPLAWLILIAAVLCAGFEWISMLNAALLAAAAMLLTGCLTAQQAERSLDVPVIVTIAASFALGEALVQTGVARHLASLIVTWSHSDALLLLILTYVAVSVLTEIITNNAAALLMMPIAIETTRAAHLDPVPFTFAIMMAASASFATPLGYQTNLMVYGPGNYRFTDFLKVGLPMNLFIGAVTLTVLVARYPLG